MESPPRSPPLNSKLALGKSEMLPALELRRSSCNREGSNSGQTSEMEPQAADQQARKIKAILEAAKNRDLYLKWETYRRVLEIETLGRIVFEHANKLIQQLDPGSEERRKLQEEVNGGLSRYTSETEKVDRSRDLRVIQDVNKKLRERYHIDRLECRLQQQEGSTDQLPDRNSNVQCSEKWRQIFEYSYILKEIIDALSEDVEPAVASRLPGTDQERSMEVDMAEKLVGTSSLLKLIKYYYPRGWLSAVEDDEFNNCIHNIVKELQADPTRNDFAAIQLWWIINTWGHSRIHENALPGIFARVGTALHWAILLQDSKMVTQILGAKDVDLNAMNGMESTPLHLGVGIGNIEIVRELLKCKERIRFTEGDGEGRTPVEIAHTQGHTDIERMLMEHETVRLYVEALYRDRQVYVDAANAILVGAALIASVTFASWLQPPMGYTLAGGHVDVEDNGGLRAFWVFNALSFYFAIGTVVFGARSVLPKQHVFIRKNVQELRRNLLVTSVLLACSVSFVIVAFGIAGSIVLMPVLKVQWTMIVPVIIGGLVCVISLGLLFKNIWNESFGTSRGSSDEYLLPKDPFLDFLIYLLDISKAGRRFNREFRKLPMVI